MQTGQGGTRHHGGSREIVRLFEAILETATAGAQAMIAASRCTKIAGERGGIG